MQLPKSSVCLFDELSFFLQVELRTIGMLKTLGILFLCSYNRSIQVQGIASKILQNGITSRERKQNFISHEYAASEINYIPFYLKRIRNYTTNVWSSGHPPFRNDRHQHGHSHCDLKMECPPKTKLFHLHPRYLSKGGTFPYSWLKVEFGRVPRK